MCQLCMGFHPTVAVIHIVFLAISCYKAHAIEGIYNQSYVCVDTEHVLQWVFTPHLAARV